MLPLASSLALLAIMPEFLKLMSRLAETNTEMITFCKCAMKSGADVESRGGMAIAKMHNRISVIMGSECSAQEITKDKNIYLCCLETLDLEDFSISEQSILTSSLEEVFRFDSVVQNTMARSPVGAQILICAGHEPSRQVRVLLLIGCHLIMSQGLGFEETVLAYRPFKDMLASHSPNETWQWLQDCWRAMCCAKYLDWIDFSESQEEKIEGAIHMDEYIHYARCAHASF